MKYSDKLRAFADYLDSRPSLTADVQWRRPHLTVYVNDSATFANMVRQAGPGEKGSIGGDYGPPTLTFDVAPEIDDEPLFGLRIEFWQPADSTVCKKVETGSIITKRRTIVIPSNAKLRPDGSYLVEEEVPEVKWECPPSFLDLV